MLLRSLMVENFRAIQSARISFDPTTVLIGENDCGRSSIVEAIALALGWNAPEGGFLFQPFHVHRGSDPDPSPIRIDLEFVESFKGEWDGEGFQILRACLPDAVGKDRRLYLEVTARPSQAETGWSLRSGGGTARAGNRDLLAWLRRRMPVFRTTEGMLAGNLAGTDRKPLPAGAVRDLADEVSRSYRDLMAGTAADVQSAVEAGAEAARQLLIARGDLLTRPGTGMGTVLEEITGKRKAPRQRAAVEFRTQGSAAQKIGTLLLVGALLRSGRGVVENGVDPLILIEDPEAHLHPMTLASIWAIMDRVAGQKIIATHSGTLLASARLSSVRRLTRHDGVVREWRVPERSLTADELRRYSYHLRSRRAAASFARCWLLVEGETEYWLMSELARVCGYGFASEGVACVEFAQCGLGALIKVARHLGIQWHLLADGDRAGQDYARSAGQHAGEGGLRDRVTLLREADIEACFWRHGYADVFRKAAYPTSAEQHANAPAKVVIQRAIQRHSKPFLAVLLLDAVIDRGPGGVPPPLRKAIETCVRLARQGRSTGG